MNYRLTIQYDGTRYDGWQRQGNTDETIQGKLEEALFQATGERAELHGAGRTDAGVHALGQVASVRLDHAVPPEELRQALNRLLPDDIAVAAVEEAGARFHARLNAAGKTYRYSIRLGATPDVFRRRFQLHLDEELDLEAMEQAAGYLTGRHDYRSFCGNKKMKKSSIRTVDSIVLRRKGDDLTLTFHGDGFLYHMVRILVGTLLEVGRGERSPEEMSAILAARDRAAAGATAPARGLALVEVDYH